MEKYLEKRKRNKNASSTGASLVSSRNFVGLKKIVMIFILIYMRPKGKDINALLEI